MILNHCFRPPLLIIVITPHPRAPFLVSGVSSLCVCYSMFPSFGRGRKGGEEETRGLILTLAVPTSCFVQRTSTCASLHFFQISFFQYFGTKIDSADIISHKKVYTKVGDQFDWFYLKVSSGCIVKCNQFFVC